MTIKGTVKGVLAFAIGVAVIPVYQFLSSPTDRTVVSEKSPDGTYACVIDEYSPWPWSAAPVAYLAFRIYTADDMQPAENESQSIWYEYLSRGREIDTASLRITWNGDVAIISDKYGSAAEWDPKDQWNSHSTPATTQATTSATNSAQ